MTVRAPERFEIAGRSVGTGEPPFVIAEIAQTHDGSLGTAHAYIDAVARTGAHAIKFQTHLAAAESTPGEPWRVKFSRQDATRYDYWKRMEFSEPQWHELAAHARERGLIFLSSAFSFEAVELLERVGMPAWKVGSGEVTNLSLLDRFAATGKPVLLSSGLATWDELDTAFARIGGRAPVAVLQCTTAYPCPPERIGLNVITELRERYRCPVGLSDHSATVWAGVAAAALGASLIEVHVAFTRDVFGPDVPASVTLEELGALVSGVAFVHRCLASPVRKDEAAAELVGLKKIFGKSVVAARALPEGHRLEAADLALKKPGSGIPAAQLERVVGRKLRRAVEADALLAEEDLA